MDLKFYIVFLCLALLMTGRLCAQQLKIGINNTRFDSSAALEIETEKQALLLPRINNLGTIVQTVKDGSLIYFNSAVSAERGFYLRSANTWNLLSSVTSSSGAWQSTGNAGTIGNLNFVGTKDLRPLMFKTNNQLRLFLDSATGNIGFNTQQPVATLHNQGATLFGVKQMGDFSSSGILGAALNTVDSFTVVSIAQNTLNVTRTLPAPTSSVAGRVFIVINQGSIPFKVGTTTLYPATAAAFIWSGSQWLTYGDGVGSGNFTVPYHYVRTATLGMMQGAAENTISQDNIAFGMNALQRNVYGTRNVAIGTNALRMNGASFANIAIGSGALSNGTSGSQNIAIGFNALLNNTGDSSVAIGPGALLSNTTGNCNTGIGYNVLNTVTTGSYNTAIGARALSVAGTTSDYNTVMGFESASGVFSSGNTVFGASALPTLDVAAGYNTAFGYAAGYTDGTTATVTNVTNATAIGAYAQLTNSNTIVLGSQPAQYATNVGVGTYTPAYKLHVNGILAGTGPLSSVSDGRLKQDIRPVAKAMKKIKALRAIVFQWNANATKRRQLETDSLTHFGFMAQEVEKILPQLVYTGKDANRLKTVAYAELVPVLAAAITEQQPELVLLQQKQAGMQQQVKSMEQQLQRIAELLQKK
ncbi:tail fiber domain-containing protein [Filimonas effusa]|nr:tail fiber domain-containing protein [Filimonas effusa]